MEDHLYDTITASEPPMGFVLGLLTHLDLPSSSKIRTQDHVLPIIIYAPSGHPTQNCATS